MTDPLVPPLFLNVPALTNDVVPVAPFITTLPSLCRSTVPLLVTTALLPMYQVPFPVMLMMPALVSGRPSRTSVFIVMVVPLGTDSRPLPPIVPLFQVIAGFVTLIGAVPFRMPELMVSVGMAMAEALLRVSVPLFIVTEPTLLIELIVVRPPLQIVVPLTL